VIWYFLGDGLGHCTIYLSVEINILTVKRSVYLQKIASNISSAFCG
jgi:hypothetical protein